MTDLWRVSNLEIVDIGSAHFGGREFLFVQLRARWPVLHDDS